ncbi:filamentous hemagglutinin N-terminal domain-containing protein [Xenophilus arseniciresistens]|uniref:Filamentous hemagglutinin N-terminal domain-containing protein n=1 Tax=Xenophilus arseniciresistens TaxID=1283306 RepID=A0AAE3NBR0_9BURK|nr:filamentous hemagglutinin N-terminal domain-containing protein [Xenophilus arseniciresistens]MDA7418741.1 filamentous hemagglutinin N-terminal domain-containing protein [Xenophilus arseniciresistens]
MRHRHIDALKTKKTLPRHWRLRPLALSLACMGMAPALAQNVAGFPMNGSVPVGGGTVTIGTPAGGLMTINQASQRGIVNWGSFSIAPNNTVNVVQPSVASVLLNRVTGGTASVIQGKLTSTLAGSSVPGSGGSVYLINPSGVVFSAGSSVSTGGLIASTLDIEGPDEAGRNATFMAGGKQLVFGGGLSDANSTARVRLEPNALIEVGEKGTVGLIGGLVRNEGQISVAQGSVGLVSGSRVTLDFEGDGLTKFSVPGGMMNISVADVQTSSGTNAQETALNASTTAQVMNAGSISGDGSRIVLMGASGVAQQVVNHSGTIRARSLASRGGEIVLEAVGANVDSSAGLSVSGSLDASAVEAGVAGGSIRTTAGNLYVAPDAKIKAGGGAGGANGRWTAESGNTLSVVGANRTGSVSAATIGAALSQGTDVTLTTRSSGTGAQVNDGVFFEGGAQIVKDGGPDATLRVNSVGNIDMRFDGELANTGVPGGVSISSTTGKLNVEFNADAQGLAILDEGLPSGAAAAIRLDNAVINANGGDILFFGQSKLDGSAVGGQVKGLEADGVGDVRSGIFISDSQLSTTGSGVIAMKGTGGIASVGSGVYSATHGVSIEGTSTLKSGAGAISLSGAGALGATGVRVLGDGRLTSLQTTSGNITVVGSTRDWATGEPVGNLSAGSGASAGVHIGNTTVQAGGDVSITGTGGDLSGMAPELQRAAASGAVFNAEVAASQGVVIEGTSVEAGAGRSISITGTAGSDGFGFDSGGNPLTYGPVDNRMKAWAVRVGAGSRLAAEGGAITLVGGTGDLRLTAGLYDTPVLNVASTTGLGGKIHVSGRNILVDSAADLPWLADASGKTGGGSITLEGNAVAGAGNENTGVVAIGSDVLLSANTTGETGNGGTIRVVGQRSLRAHGRFEARGGSAGGNGGSIETSGGSFDISGVRIDASAPSGTGQAGKWTIDPYDVTIVDGNASGSLPSNPFDPVFTSFVQDGDINAALDSGTSVTLTTGTSGTDPGDIRFGSGVVIERTVGSNRVAFQLDAANNIGKTFSSSWAAPTIRSTTGPMDVIFNASLGGKFGSIDFGGSSAADRATISTQGGNVIMRAGGTSSSISVYDTSINTGGGNLDLQSGTAGVAGDSSRVYLDASVTTGGGNASITAYGGANSSVELSSSAQLTTNGGAVSILTGQTDAPSGTVYIGGAQIDTRVGQSDAGAGGALTIESGSVTLSGTQIATATGNVSIVGTGSFDGSPGVSIRNDSQISTTSGNVEVKGVVRANPSSAFFASHGVVVGGGSGITTGAGSIRLQGSFGGTSFDGTDSGVRLEEGASLITRGGDIELTGSSTTDTPGLSIQPGGTPSLPGAAPVVQSGGNLILRASSNGGQALVIDAPVSAAGTINLRPGGLDDSSLTTFDATETPITVGGAAGSGFTVSDAMLARLNAPSVVIGSNTHAATITVAGPVSRAGALTLQNQGVSAGGLAASGIVLNGGITADRLGLLSWGDIRQTAQAPIVAQHLLARSGGGSVLLDQAPNNVSENTLGGGASGDFRYQDVDAVRLGSVSVTGFDAAANQSQVVSATSMSANTVFVRTLSGDLTLDTPITTASGTELVAASRFQNPGGGSISGAPWRIWAYTWEGESRGGLAGTAPDVFRCPYPGACAGIIGDSSQFIYATGPVVVTPPVVTPPVVTPQPEPPTFVRPVMPVPDVVRDMPNTYTFDRNIGPLPMCFATGALGSDQARGGSDLLAREWSRVRSRPNLTSCVDTERKNGCADF